MPHSGLQKTPAAIAFGSATVSSSVKAIGHGDFGFSTDQLAEAERAVIGVEDASVNMRYDGGNPGANTGHHLVDDAGKPLIVLGNGNINNLKFIRDSGGVDGVVSITLEMM